MSVYNGYIHAAIGMVRDAISNVLESSDCTAFTGSTARSCVTGPRLLKELKVVELPGVRGKAAVDSNGERAGSFWVEQVVRGSSPGKVDFLKVATLEPESNLASVTHRVSWTHLEEVDGTPTSFCSLPCGPGTAKLVTNIRCCWQCVGCRKNERATSADGCIRCPDFQWPNKTSGNTTCMKITPVLSHWETKAWVVNVATAVIGLVLCLVAAVFYCRLRANSFIKNSPLVLSYVALFGITLGFVALLVELFHPSEASCRLSNLLVSLSFTTLYGAVFTRCACSYRIFDAFLKHAPPPRYTEPRHQLFFTLGLLLVQVRSCRC